MTSSSATILKIAEEVGVSHMTVSRVLRGPNNFRRSDAAARAKQILAAARRLGYRPHAAARIMRAGRFGSIALLISSQPHRSALPDTLVGGITQVLNQHDLNLSLVRMSDEELTDSRFMPRILTEYMADGLLIDYFDRIPARMMQIIDQYNIPHIWINHRREHSCVYPDDLDAGRRATQGLLSMGHQRIAFAHFTSSTHYSVADRYEGYEAAMRQAGLQPIRLSEPGGILIADRVVYAEHHLKHDRPTAIVGYDDVEVNPILFAACRLGLQVPRDLSLVAFHNQPFSMAGLNIQTLIVPEQAVGRFAVEMLLQRISGTPKSLQPARSVPFDFVPGDSVCRLSN